MTLFFTSDTHFHHHNIINFCKRPFSSTDEMNEELISRWNAEVGPGDVVYHLGDFTWYEDRAKEIFQRLNGEKHLIIGNHDYRKVRKLPWTSVQYATKLATQGLTIYLSHYPVVGFRESLLLHGHLHKKSPLSNDEVNGRPVVDVGVDGWGYRPVSLRQILINTGLAV